MKAKLKDAFIFFYFVLMYSVLEMRKNVESGKNFKKKLYLCTLLR